MLRAVGRHLVAAVLCVGVLELWFTSAVASAHDESRRAVSAVVTSVTPAVEGLSARGLLSVAPLLELRNESRFDILVLGLNGEPFLRLGRRGVEGNGHSPTFEQSSHPFVERTTRATAELDATPEWVSIGAGRTWRWFDPRLVGPATAGSRDAAFAIPIRVGGVAGGIHGHLVSDDVGRFESRLDSVPRIHGLEIALLDGRVPALYIRNDTGRVLDVLGLDGEPMLRIGPGGVQANTRSPSYQRSVLRATTAVTARADPGAPPGWTRRSDEPRWALLELRAELPGRGETAFDLGTGEGVLLGWRTPMLFDGEAIAVEGHVRWLPYRHERRWSRPWLPATGAAVASGAALVLSHQYLHASSARADR